MSAKAILLDGCELFLLTWLMDELHVRGRQSNRGEDKFELMTDMTWNDTLCAKLLHNSAWLRREWCIETFPTNASSIKWFFSLYFATVTNELTEPWLCGLTKIMSAFCHLLGAIVVITCIQNPIELISSSPKFEAGQREHGHRRRHRPLLAYLILT